MKMLIDNLKANNLKVTPQRLIIYTYLYKNTTHPSAEDIYNSIKEEISTISLATVYKTLNSLKNASLINEINVGEDSFRYDANIKPHSHIICKKCKNILDCYQSQDKLENIKKDVEKSNEFDIDFTQIYFHGICKSCR